MSTISAGQLSPRAAWAFLAAGVALLAAATVAPPAAATGPLVIVALGAIAAIVTGYRRQTSVPRPWQLMAAACGLFLIGLVLRALVPAPALLPVQLAPRRSACSATCSWPRACSTCCACAGMPTPPCGLTPPLSDWP